MFIDRVKLRLIAGKGGNGVVAWRREKYVPKGGPCGGNGGAGGGVVLQADEGVASLEEYRFSRVLKAEVGRPGGSNRCNGRNGKDLIIKVPVGTIVRDQNTNELLCDLTEHGEKLTFLSGGGGGRGNASFKSPTHRAPAKCTAGREGQEREVDLELKLIADVGLVGFPNAGKSTFIHSATKVPVKIAPYPFTTLRPNLGYVEFDDYSRLLIADIPGIIHGASDNRGLGLQFLRHIERTKVLIYVLDVSCIDGRDPISDYRVLRQELQAYDPELLFRPYLVVLNKCDEGGSEAIVEEFRKAYPDETPFPISALDKEQVVPVLKAVRRVLKELAASEIAVGS